MAAGHRGLHGDRERDRSAGTGKQHHERVAQRLDLPSAVGLDPLPQGPEQIVDGCGASHVPQAGEQLGRPFGIHRDQCAVHPGKATQAGSRRGRGGGPKYGNSRMWGAALPPYGPDMSSSVATRRTNGDSRDDSDSEVSEIARRQKGTAMGHRPKRVLVFAFVLVGMVGLAAGPAGATHSHHIDNPGTCVDRSGRGFGTGQPHSDNTADPGDTTFHERIHKGKPGTFAFEQPGNPVAVSGGPCPQ